MAVSVIESLRIKAKLLQKAKKRAGKPIQLKEAFEILAKTSGFKSWRELKEIFEATEHYCPPGSSARSKIWVKNYDEAKAQLESVANGYLLPYRDHFFICDWEYIEFLGVEKDDPDLDAIGRNWVEPINSDAFTRISQKIRVRAGGSK